MQKLLTRPQCDTDVTKTMKLREFLKKYIACHPVGTRLPSYTTLMKEHGVSQNTVMNALNELVKDKKIICERRRGMFISPRAALTNIGVVFGRDIFSANAAPVSRMFLRYIEDEATTHNENISLFINTKQVMIEDHGIMVNRDLLDALNSDQMDGLILVETRGKDEVEWLLTHNLPIVTMSSYSHTGHVVTSNIGSMVDLAMEELIKRGCQKIALLSMYGNMGRAAFNNDMVAYKNALSRCGLKLRNDLVFQAGASPADSVNYPQVSNEQTGFQAAEFFLNGTDQGHLPFDGFICTDDRATSGFLSKLSQMGITPGQDIIIATHVNRAMPVLMGYEDKLIRIEINPEALMHKAFEVLRKLIAGQRDIPKLILVESQIII